MIFQIPATIKKFEPMANKAIKLRIDTQEDISPDLFKKLVDSYDQFGWFTFSVEHEIKTEDLTKLPKLDVPKGRKTRSQLLREAIWIFGLNEGAYEAGDKEKADEFYLKQMDKLIDFVRSKSDA